MKSFRFLFFFAIVGLSSLPSEGFWDPDFELTELLKDVQGRGLLPSTKEVDQWIEASTDPEIGMSPVEMIQRWDYPAEEYQVTTQDGYLLSVQRIPGGCRHHGNASSSAKGAAGRKPAIFLMHGLLASATNFIANLPNQSFAFMLADAGFDVWMGNARGNTYSKRHTQFSPKDKAFWKFSWDEIAKFDIPAMIDFVLWKTGEKQLYYAGHSQGSMVMFAKGSEDLDFGKKIKKFFALGPVTTMGHVEGVVRIFGKIGGFMDFVTSLLGVGAFMPQSKLIDLMAKIACKSSSLKFLCSNILFLIAGQDASHMNQTRLPVYMTHTPAGTSVQNIVHYGQGIKNGKFQKHDYGFIGNTLHYGTFTAPLYDVSQMEIPTVLFWSQADTLADAEDVRLLIPQIKNLVGNYYFDDVNHLDFVWGLEAAEDIYNPIIKMIEEDEKL